MSLIGDEPSRAQLEWRIEELEARIEELEMADIEAGAWITEWMLADKYRKPDIPAVVRQARKAYQQTMAENERLNAVYEAAKEYERMFARSRTLPYSISNELQTLFEALAAVGGNEDE